MAFQNDLKNPYSIIIAQTKTDIDNATTATHPLLEEGMLIVAQDTNEVYNFVNNTTKILVGRAYVDTAANRPSAGVPGRIFIASDTEALSVDTGSAWLDASFTGDLDDIDDGTTYGRVLQTELSSGQVNRLSDGSNTVTVAEIAADLRGGARRDSVLDYITDNTLAPPTENTGDRYILAVDGGAPNAGWDGASAGDIVEFDGTSWQALTPEAGWVAWSVDDSEDYLYDGSAWVARPAVVTNHNDLGGLQGGTTNEYYHMTADEDGALANAASAPTAANPIVTEADAVMDGDAAGGDLTGTYPDPTVAAIRGNTIQTGSPGNNALLKFDTTSGEWEYTKVISGGSL